jgi:hypothetical protein
MGDGLELLPDPRHQPHQDDEGAGTPTVIMKYFTRHRDLHSRETFELPFVRIAAALTGIINVRRLVCDDLVDAKAGRSRPEGQRSS